MAKCRICNNELGKPFLSLGNFPLSNSYLTEINVHNVESYYPLDVYVCKKCFLVQLEDVVPPEDIFSSNYLYFSSFSESWLQHCKEYTKMVIERFGLSRDSFVIEIGSNDGYLLQYFKEYNISVLGVEPAANTAKMAKKIGIPTDICFFNTSYAKKMRSDGKLADLIIGNNVLAHNPNLNDFVEGLRIALKSKGIITMEFPHLLKLIEENQFDTIYHEHYSYFSLSTVQKLFSAHNLELFDVEEIPTHGGSLRIYARHKEVSSEQLPVSSNIANIINKEIEVGLNRFETYQAFAKKVKMIKRNILNFLIQAKKENKTIVGYGAAAKGNTLLNYCGIKTDFIDYVVDRNPHKQGHYLPGSHIPIETPDKIRDTKPDYVLILPWNIKDEIMEQMTFIREWGGKFVVLIPEVKIY